MRLFVALDLPALIKNDLSKIEPSPARGVQQVPPDQLHVTVHFIGVANAEEVRQALEAVHCKPIRLSVRGVGQFKVNGGRTILWAGVSETEELLELHAACGRALNGIGIKVERRRFVPHVTLARLKPFVHESIIETFLREGDDRDFGDGVAERFVLYNSVNEDDGARYEYVSSWQLR
jgi:2'-5' RNA ligase